MIRQREPFNSGRLLLYLALPWFVAGCRVVQTVADLPGRGVRAVTPGKKEKNTVDPVELQQNLVRFADEFSARMNIGVEKLRRTHGTVSPAEVLQAKIGFATEITSIASGPNAVANVLDMTVLVTVTRAALEEHYVPDVFGESAQPLLDACKSAEQEIWQLTSTMLNPDQQAELRNAIEVWRKTNPLPEGVLAARAVGFSLQTAATMKSSENNPSGLFDLLNLDPLSSLDPATREIAETRLFAERALYVTRRMPQLLRWQTELLAINATEMPAVQQLVANSTELTATSDRLARVAEQLPGQVSAEREEILKGLEGQEKQLTPLMKEVRQTLDSGNQMSASLNTTLVTFDALMKRFGVGETKNAGPPSTNSQPFRITDYGQTATQIAATAKQLTELLVTLDQTLGSTNLASLTTKVTPAVEHAQVSGKELGDHLFYMGILFVVIAAAIVLVAVLLYRVISHRILPRTAARTAGNN